MSDTNIYPDSNMSGSWVPVDGYINGEVLNEDTMNRPIQQLSERTQYLYNLLKNLDLDSMNAIRFIGVKIEPDTPLGSVVYLDQSSNTYKKAISSVSTSDDYEQSNSSYALGIVSSISSENAEIGTVTSYGLVEFDSTFKLSSLVDNDSVNFVSGNYYLSGKQAGKISQTPGAPRVFVGKFFEYDGTPYAIVTLSKPDLNHRHRTYNLHAKPAGEQYIIDVDSDGSPTPTSRHVVVGYTPSSIDGQAVTTDPIFRLRVIGSWLNQNKAWYKIKVYQNPDTISKDIILSWEEVTAKDNPRTGASQVDKYFTPISIGSYGVQVFLEPYDFAAKVTEFDLPSIQSEYEWDLDMPYDGQGWRASNITTASSDPLTAKTANGTVMSLYGSIPDSTYSNIYGFITDSLISFTVSNTVEDGALLDGVSIIFDDNNKYIFSNEEVDGYTSIPVGGTISDSLMNAASVIGFNSGEDYPIFSIVKNSSNGVKFDTLILSKTATIYPNDTLTSDLYHVVNIDNQFNSVFLFTNEFITLTPEILWHASTNSVFEIPDTDSGLTFYLSVNSRDSLVVGDFWLFNLKSYQLGCAFRYAVEMDLQLNKAFPPIPEKSCDLSVNGISQLQDVYSSDGIFDFKVANNALGWRSNSYSKVPWPVDYIRGVPGNPVFAVNLLFTMQKYTVGNSGPVTSLRPAPNSPIKVLDCGTGESSNVGDLMLDIDLLTNVYASNVPGYKAVKTSRNGKLVSGPLVEQIIAGPGIFLQQYKDHPRGQGKVIISSQDLYNGDFEEVALENAKQEQIGMFPYIKLLGWSDGSSSNIPSAFVSKFTVPSNLSEGNYRIRVYATIFGEKSIPENALASYIAGIEFTYNILPDYNPLNAADNYTEYNLANNYITRKTPFTAKVRFGRLDNNQYVYNGFDPLLIHNNPEFVGPTPDSKFSFQNALGTAFPTVNETSNSQGSDNSGIDFVKPGYIVAVRFSRTNSGAGNYEYTGGIGFTNLRWELIKVD